MKISLEQKLELKLLLTPQLKLRLEILCMPAAELEERVKMELEENPLLEEEERSEESWEEEKSVESWEVKGEEMETWGAEFKLGEEMDDEMSDPLSNLPSKLSLAEHLALQAESRFSGVEKEIAYAIISNLDEKGFLKKEALKEIAKAIGVGEEDVDKVRRVMMEFDPEGIASYGIVECLEFQAKMLSDDVKEAVLSALDRLKKAAKEGESEVEIPEEISMLEPYPARSFEAVASGIYIYPDVEVRENKDTIDIIINEQRIPKLRINGEYRKLLKYSEAAKFLKERYERAKALIEAIEKRRDTLYRVTQAIFEHQREFLREGKSGLKSMTLKDVAEKVGIHYSTISRTIRGKWIKTPWGVFELKSFFSTGIRNFSGEAISRDKVKEEIKKLLEGRNISDLQIAKILNERGYNIARRTVAKYRAEMGIPSTFPRNTTQQFRRQR